MNKHAENDGLSAQVNRSKSTVNVNETFWGYVISKGGLAPILAASGELAATVGCIVFGFAAYAHWLLPGSTFGAQLLPFKIASTIMFFVFAILLYLIAHRGLMSEVQIDVKQREVRLVRRNREGASVELDKFEFARVNSVYMKRTQPDAPSNQLFFEVMGRRAPIWVAMGTAREIESLMIRIREDVRTRKPANTPRPVRVKPAAKLRLVRGGSGS